MMTRITRTMTTQRRRKLGVVAAAAAAVAAAVVAAAAAAAGAAAVALVALAAAAAVAAVDWADDDSLLFVLLWRASTMVCAIAITRSGTQVPFSSYPACQSFNSGGCCSFRKCAVDSGVVSFRPIT